MSVDSFPVNPELWIAKRPRRLKKSHPSQRFSIQNTVNPEVKQWIKESVKHHWYLFEVQGKLHIAFHNSNDAMLFKLTWH